MAIRDSFVGFARETTYNTFVSPTRSFEAEGDPLTRDGQDLERTGLRAGRHARRVAEKRRIARGAGGTLPLTVFDSGMGMLLRAMLDTAAVAQVGATAAYLQTFASAQEFNGESLSGQVVRGRPAGTKAFTYTGITIPEWEIAQAVDDYLKVSLTLDACEAVDDESAHTATYVDADEYAWPDLAVTIDGSAVAIRSFALSANRGLATDRYRLRGSALKKIPVRTEDPSYELDLEFDWEDDDIYDLVVSGATVPVVATWTGANIESTEDHFLRITLPAVQFGADQGPTVDPSDEPTQPGSAMVLHDDTDPAVTIEYQSTDTAH